jgi:hypothetical protein
VLHGGALAIGGATFGARLSRAKLDEQIFVLVDRQRPSLRLLRELNRAIDKLLIEVVPDGLDTNPDEAALDARSRGFRRADDGSSSLNRRRPPYLGEMERRPGSGCACSSTGEGQMQIPIGRAARLQMRTRGGDGIKSRFEKKSASS